MMRNGLWAIAFLALAAPLAQAQAPIVSYYSGPPPVVVEPSVTYYTPAPVVSYYRAPVAAYYPPPAPVVTYYAPSVRYYAPAPVYYTPAPVGVTTYRYGLFGLRQATVVNYGW